MAATDSLLLLPAPPSPPTKEAFRAAYLSPLTAALKEVRDLQLSTAAVLQIVLQLPPLPGRLSLPSTQLFDEYQRLVGELYALTAMISAREDIEVDGPGAVDVRVILCAAEEAHPLPDNLQVQPLAGPIVDLPSLAWTRRSWRWMFAVDGEAGQQLLSRYLHLAALTRPPLEGEVKTLSGGVSLRISSPETFLSRSDITTHTTVAVGGTFDHLHAGHKLLLTATALLLQPSNLTTSAASLRRLVVGITGDELLKNKKYAEYLESWQKRQERVVAFLKTVLQFHAGTDADVTETYDEPGPNGHAVHTTLAGTSIRIEAVKIEDPFGPTITDESISALAVSAETRSGGEAVNVKRREKGFADLQVFEVEVLDAGDQTEVAATNGATPTNFDSKISSTEIRKRKAEQAQQTRSTL